MRDGAGIDTDNIADRIVAYYPEIRDILYEYLNDNREISPEKIGDPAVVGHWKFVPESMAEKALGRDMDLLF